MLFKKNYGELVQRSLNYLKANTRITNTNIGGITRSLIEIINKNISEYYDILDVNMNMGFLSTSEGYFLDLIGDLFNMPRIQATAANASSVDGVQKFYVVSGYLIDKVPSGIIPANTVVSSTDGSLNYYISADTNFAASATEVYVPITANAVGTKLNVPQNTLVSHNLNISDLFTTNEKSIVSGTDTESDANYKYRLMNATVAAEKANEISVRLAALSVNGVADVIIKPYARGIGSFDVIVIPVEGIATDSLISSVQSAINDVTACGMKGTAIKPTIVPVDIEVKLIFNNDATDFEKSDIKSQVKTSIEKYTTNIPLGGEFIYNELIQQIMDVSQKIKDTMVTCYFFREEPTFLGNVSIYWDEMFYPNPNSAEAIRVL